MNIPQVLKDLFVQEQSLQTCKEQIEKLKQSYKFESERCEKMLKECKPLSMRVARFFQASQGYEEGIHPSYLSDHVVYLELKDTAVVCRVGTWARVEEISFDVLNMSDEDFTQYLNVLRKARKKKCREAEKEQKEIEEIDEYLTLLESKPVQEEKLKRYKKKYGEDVTLLIRRLNNS